MLHESKSSRLGNVGIWCFGWKVECRRQGAEQKLNTDGTTESKVREKVREQKLHVTQGHFFQVHGPQRPPSSSHSNDVVSTGAPLTPPASNHQPATAHLAKVPNTSPRERALRSVLFFQHHKKALSRRFVDEEQTSSPSRFPFTVDLSALFPSTHPNERQNDALLHFGMPPAPVSRACSPSHQAGRQVSSWSSKLVGSRSVKQHANKSQLGVHAVGGGDGIVHAPHHPHPLHHQAEDVHVCPPMPAAFAALAQMAN